MLVDSHAHIFKEYYDDIDNVVINAKKNNVLKIVNCATSLNNIDEVILTSKQHGFYYALGIHPEEVNSFDNDTKIRIKKYILDNIDDEKFIAIGEIGLDFYYGKETKEKQIELLEFQMSLAEKYNKPVIIHSRDATLDTINVLKRYKVKGVIHCFSGSYETACEYIKMGYMIGIGGLVTFKNSNLKNYIEKIGIDNIILETDSPYMTPEPFRGKKNEPKNVLEIAIFLSKILNISLEKIAKKTTKNCAKIFDIIE